MDKITKFLMKLSAKERLILMDILMQIQSDSLDGLDISKLSGEEYLYRVRKGKFRVIFMQKEGEKNKIINLDYRGNIYKNL